jgi:hypothetical protein
MKSLVSLLLAASTLFPPSRAATIKVGPAQTLQTPGAAAAIARDGDTVEIEAGDYTGDVAVWRAHRLTLRGVNGSARLNAAGKSAEQKAIWVIKGDDTTVEHIEFSGCRVPDRNGAGIRQEGANLTVRHCRFHNNENGILTSAHRSSDILVEYSEFGGNGFGDGYSHNLYIGNVRRFTLRHCWSHGSRTGHLVKSRASENLILCNRLDDGPEGGSSYVVDLPDGGRSFILGNLLRHGPRAANGTGVSYAAESTKNELPRLFVAHNTFISERPAGGRFVRVGGREAKAVVVNNLVVGTKVVLDGAGDARDNIVTDAPGFFDAAGGDFRLKPGSPALEACPDPGKVGDTPLLPDLMYLHPLGRQPRPAAARPNAGAF